MVTTMMTRALTSFFATLLAAMSLAPSAAAAPPPNTPVGIDEPAYYPEGPTLWRESLYWAEMPAHRVRRLRSGRAETVWESPGCGPTSVKRDAGRGFWILCHLAHQVVLVDNAFKEKARFDRDEGGAALAWPNDATSDAAGRLYFSSAGVFDLDAPATGRVMFIDTDHRVRAIVHGLRYANGVVLDPAQKRLFVSEHLARRIHVIELSAPGVVGMRRVFFDFDKGGVPRAKYPLAGPDGLRVIGNELFVAEYGAGRLHAIGLDGALRRTIEVPTPYVTNMEHWPSRKLLVVVGTFDNNSRTLEGRVLSVRQ